MICIGSIYLSEGVRAGDPPLNIAARGARLHYNVVRIKGFGGQLAYFWIKVATIYGNAINATIATSWPDTVDIHVFAEKYEHAHKGIRLRVLVNSCAPEQLRHAQAPRYG